MGIEKKYVYAAAELRVSAADQNSPDEVLNYLFENMEELERIIKQKESAMSVAHDSGSLCSLSIVRKLQQAERSSLRSHRLRRAPRQKRARGPLHRLCEAARWLDLLQRQQSRAERGASDREVVHLHLEKKRLSDFSIVPRDNFACIGVWFDATVRCCSMETARCGAGRCDLRRADASRRIEAVAPLPICCGLPSSGLPVSQSWRLCWWCVETDISAAGVN